MRISDWSSDVCSSDLTADRVVDRVVGPVQVRARHPRRERWIAVEQVVHRQIEFVLFVSPHPEARGKIGIPDGRDGIVVDVDALDEGDVILPLVDVTLLPTKLDRTGLVIRGEGRSEERRVGKECVSTCRSRWWPYH